MYGYGYGYGYGGGLFYIQGFVLQSMTAILPRLGPGRVPASSRDNNTLMSKATPLHNTHTYVQQKLDIGV